VRPRLRLRHLSFFCSPSRYTCCTSTVQQIEDPVMRLSPEQRAAFRQWFAEYDAQEWDRQLERDVAAGKLDWLIAEANADRQAGRNSVMHT
jgi:hypothetical protein